MGLYTKVIVNREKNNIHLEENADESLQKNQEMRRIENQVEDAQTTLLFILDKFGISVDRMYGYTKVSEMLENILDPMGMMYDYAESAITDIANKTEYVLAFRKDGKSVALLPTKLGYSYYCPSDNEIGYASKKFCKNLKEGCYILHRPLEEKGSILGTITYNILKEIRLYDVIRIVIAVGLATILGLIIPVISKWVYNDYLNDMSKPIGALFLAFITYLVVCVIKAGLSFIKQMMLAKIKVRISMKVQSMVMAKVLHLSSDFFKNISSGKFSKRMSNCGRLSDMVLSVYMDVILDVVFSVAYLYQLNSFAEDLFLPALAFVSIRIVLALVIAFFNGENEKKNLKNDMESSGLLYSSIRGVQKIKGMGAEKILFSKWADYYRKTLSLNYEKPFFVKYGSEITSAVTSLATIVFLSVAVGSNISAGDYMTFTTSYALVISVVSALSNLFTNGFLIWTLSDNVKPLFEAKTEQNEILEYVKKLRGNVKTENIYFSYNDDQRGCLRGVSLNVKAGEKVAIVGESGCGKSTLLKVLLGMEKPKEGIVYYDGKSLDTINLRSLRRRIGSVFQFTKVFAGSIYDNVTFRVSEHVEEDAIWDVLDRAAIGDEIRELPMGIHTSITESNSCGFSGGQRQRILIARALLGNPQILILDEATSALDNRTQAKVLDSIMELKSTVIMVAHRLSTVVDFDRIIVLRDGTIVEEGTYSDLMEQDGYFAELVRKQMA